MDKSQQELVKDLHTVWFKFLVEENNEQKEYLVQLFLYMHQLIEDEFLQSAGFLKSVPSQLCCYMLELVYGIICTAVKNTSSEAEFDSSTEFDRTAKSTLQQLWEDSVETENFGITELILGAPSDITAIVSLRKFLTQGLGSRILEFLHKSDLKAVTSRKSLVRLLVNLFPNTSWDNEGAAEYNITKTLCLSDLICRLNLLEFSTYSAPYPFGSISLPILPPKRNDLYSISEKFDEFIIGDISSIHIDMNNFQQFQLKSKTSAEIAEILIDLLDDFVKEESDVAINQNSVTLECLRFSLETFKNIENSNAFKDCNKEILRLKLLSLIILCCNNLFSRKSNFLLIDFKIVLKTFFQIIEQCDSVDLQNNNKKICVSACLYIVFGILNNILIIYNAKYDKFIEISKIISVDRVSATIKTFNLLTSNDNEQYLEFIKKFIEDITKLVTNIRFITQRNNRKIKTRKKQRLQNIYQRTKQIHCKTNGLPCIFEEIILKIFQSLQVNQQKIVVKHFQKNGFCCCLYNIDILSIMLLNSYDNLIEKLLYKFLRRRVLKTIFVKNDCSLCESKGKSNEFHEQIFLLYKQKFNNIHNNLLNITVYLKHLFKISNYMSFNISSKILVDIVLPIFRSEKYKKNLDTLNLNIILKCLNIFINYLNDVRLIKGFYIDENVKYLKELLYIPELTKSVCDLIRIGIDNSPFLGDNSSEQINISQELFTMQLDATKYATQVINCSIIRLNKNIKLFVINDENNLLLTKKSYHNPIQKLIESGSMTLSQSIYLASVYWNLSLELYKTNQQYRVYFHETYPQLLETQVKRKDLKHIINKCDLFQLVYNTLTLFLIHIPKDLTTTTDIVTSSCTFSDSQPGKCNVTRESSIMFNSNDIIGNERESIHTYLDSVSATIDSRNCTPSSSTASAATSSNITLQSDERRDKIFDDDILSQISFIEVITKSCDAGIKSEFLDKLKSSDNVVIFDIRNQSVKSSNCKNNQSEITEHNSEQHLLSNGLQTINWIISSGLNYFFGINSNEKKCDNSDITFTKEKDEIDSDLYCLCETGSCKPYLLQIFESVLAAFIMENFELKVSKMQLFLKKLKDLITTHSTKNWHDTNNASAIIQALQSLLKVAEMTNRPSTLDDNKRSFTVQRRDTGEKTIFNSSMDSDTEYHTSKMSCNQAESDVELSENDTEEFYMTADEGYEADAEIPDISEMDEDIEAVWSPYSPSSRYRTHIVHEGICKIIIEILIHLSEKCINDPGTWSSNLSQLANRLYVIRESLGGSLFLLEGFAPILSTNDVKLRDFQQSILDLITDLNTPEVLSNYLRILASDNPPVDILIKYMSYVSIGNVQIQPSAELEFPIYYDGTIKSSCNPLMYEKIKQMRNYHKFHMLETPFTKSACIIPINRTKLWDNEGFTISVWMQIKSCYSSSKSPSLHNVEDKNNDYEKEQKKIHLISIGSNQLILSIYITNNLNLSFETSRPTAEIKTDREKNLNKNAQQNYNHNNKQLNQPMYSLKRKKKERRTSIPLREINENEVSSSLNKDSLVDKETQTTTPEKISIVNSFFNSITNFPFFSSSHHESENIFEEKCIELKHFRLPRRKWTHLCFAIDMKSKPFNITITIDGCEQYIISLPCNNIRQLTKTENFQVICLGQAEDIIKEDDCDISKNENTLPRYGLANCMVFHKAFNDKRLLSHLTALGPDCQNLTYCQVGNIIPNYGLLNYSKSFSFDVDDFIESSKILKENLIATYSAHGPTYVTSFDKDIVGYTAGRQFGVVLAGNGPVTYYVPSIQTAVFMCGGLSCLIYLFARVVELTSDSTVQSLALDLLLSIASSNADLFTEFIKRDYLSLIGYVIKTDNCAKDVYLLRSIINNACTQPVISKRNDTIQILECTPACVIYSNLIIRVIKRYSDWHRYGSKDSKVLDVLLTCIQSLVREKHPHQSFNISQLAKAGLVKELLNLCKIYIIEAPNPVYISEKSAELFVSILRTFAGSPPSPSLLDEIMKLLLLLQKPSECYVTHDRSKFYFLISPDPPIKHKRINLPLPSRQLKQLIRDRKKSAPTIRTTAFRKSFSKEEFNELGKRGSVSYGRSKSDGSENRKFSDRKNNFIFCINDSETLEAIADCSKIDKKTITTLNSNGINKWRVSLQTSNKVRQNHISRKRIRSIPWSNAEIEIRKKRKRHKSASDSSAELSFVPPKEYDVVHSDEVSSFDGSTAKTLKRKKSLIKSEFYKIPGIIKLQEGLYVLLKDFLHILPDNSIEEVLTHYVKAEILLVLSNHHSSKVRAAIVRLLSALCNRLPTSELQALNKKYFWHHLGNQLSIWPADKNLIEACIQWATGSFHTVEEYLTQEEFQIEKKYALNALIAILPQTLENIDLAVNTLELMNKIYKSDASSRVYFSDNGLIQSIAKTLFKLFMKIKPVNYKIEEIITDLLYNIGKNSIKSTGNINAIWEILNLLSFYQENDIASVVRGFRSIQACILLNLLKDFLPKSASSSTSSLKIKISDINLPDSLLTPSEIKTRFDLILDRCSQFFIGSPLSYKPTSKELELFEQIIALGISGNIRSQTLISWGLLPSRSTELRSSIINELWRVFRNDSMTPLTYDGKTIKSLLWSCLYQQSDNNLINEECCENLSNLCKKFGISKNDLTYFETDVDKLEFNRENCLTKQKPAIERIIYKYESIANSCIESSMTITRNATELQNSERKILMNQMKEYDESFIYQDWVSIIEKMTHEGAPWYCEKNYPRSWELDDTEGPSRVRVRLRRHHLDIDPRFLMIDAEDSYQEKIRPLEYLISAHDQHLNFSLNSRILYNFPSKYLPVDGEIDGELLITDEKLYFVATYRCKFYYLSCDIKSITEIWLRRYQHQEKAFEILLDSNKSKFFALENIDDFKIIKEILADKIIQCPDQTKLLIVTQQWREGLLTNWEYLMTLNQLSGRTYNDLMQYPVFPWILSNFNSDFLDLKDEKNFRKLEKPIAVQHKQNELHYINNYTYINNTMSTMGTLQLKPYHYSSHYSNSGTVLHFLVRVPPFTSYFLRYQDNNFDLPDRTFHSINTTWRLASKDSPTDVKELIPEFFCLPEMFENFERFNFGYRQSGELVDDVNLPPWCLNNSRYFVLIHRQALESEIVRNNLHNWIDLIFGYKQTGPSAVEAINVFHPATYSEFHISDISDPIEKKAVETMIKTYGQMPKQLLKIAHPQSKQLFYNPYGIVSEALPSISGLRWGAFTGSPELPEPQCSTSYTLPDTFSSLVAFPNTNVVYGLPKQCCVMQGPEADTYNLISWNHDDQLIRIQPLSKPNSRPEPLLYNKPIDAITSCGSDTSSNSLWFGHKSGRISVYQCCTYDLYKFNKTRQSQSNIKLSYNSAFRKFSTKNTLKVEDGDHSKDSLGSTEFSTLKWTGPIILIRHTDEVTCISLSTDFKIAVSAGRDGIAVIWDLNSFCYVRTIAKPLDASFSPITLAIVSPTLGDILTVHSIEKPEKENPSEEDECFEITEGCLDDFVNVPMNLSGKSIMRLHSVNARYINHKICEDKITSICYSYIKEGVGINVIVTGMENCVVKLWSSWDLKFIREFFIKSEILSLTYSTYQHLVVLTKNNFIQVWQSDGLLGNPPKFPQINFKPS